MEKKMFIVIAYIIGTELIIPLSVIYKIDDKTFICKFILYINS